MTTCQICGETFEVGRVYSNHVRWKHRDQPLSEAGRKALSEAAKRGNFKRLGYEGSKYSNQVCINCGAVFSNKKKRQYCQSPACQFLAHAIGGRVGGEVLWKDRDKRLAIVRANNKANPAWLAQQSQYTGKKKKYFSSKGERALVSHIKEQIPDIKWSTGGLHNIGNGLRKSLDLYSKDPKVIVEYDGIYHWKNVYGNLPEVQMKDRQLESFCELEGWKLIRVNEETVKKVPKIRETIINMIENYESLPAVTKLYLHPEL